MPYLLNLVYLLGLIVLSPWLIYRSLRTGKHRRGLWRKWTGQALLRNGPEPCAWFHGVSVGEVNLLRPIVAQFRRRHPEWECVISASTDTGYREACKNFPDLHVFFWPFDFSWAVHRALRNVNPSLVVLAEGELWPNFLIAAKERGVPVAIVNGRLSPRSFRRYRRLGGVVKRMFAQVDLLAMQTEEYAACLCTLGAVPERVKVTGSVKFDGVATDRRSPRTQELGRLLNVQAGDLVWIAGSTQAPEEEVVFDIYRRARAEHANLRLILVPRQPERFDEVAALLRRSGEPWVRRSSLTQPLAGRQAVVLMDSIGELAALWGLADVAYVGGSLDGRRGGQNMIEPAAYGAAVVFGPHVWNFRDTAVRLVEAGAAVQIEDAAGLERSVRQLLGDAALRRRMGTAARWFVLQQQGATEQTLDLLDELLTAAAEQQRAA